MKRAKAARGETPRDFSKLNEAETRDIRLWFGWGTILGYPTGPRDYLRDAMKPANKALFLAMPRLQRRAVLRYIIDENNLRNGLTR